MCARSADPWSLAADQLLERSFAVFQVPRDSWGGLVRQLRGLRSYMNDIVTDQSVNGSIRSEWTSGANLDNAVGFLPVNDARLNFVYRRHDANDFWPAERCPHDAELIDAHRLAHTVSRQIADTLLAKVGERRMAQLAATAAATHVSSCSRDGPWAAERALAEHGDAALFSNLLREILEAPRTAPVVPLPPGVQPPVLDKITGALLCRQPEHTASSVTTQYYSSLPPAPANHCGASVRGTTDAVESAPNESAAKRAKYASTSGSSTSAGNYGAAFVVFAGDGESEEEEGYGRDTDFLDLTGESGAAASSAAAPSSSVGRKKGPPTDGGAGITEAAAGGGGSVVSLRYERERELESQPQNVSAHVDGTIFTLVWPGKHDDCLQVKDSTSNLKFSGFAGAGRSWVSPASVGYPHAIRLPLESAPGVPISRCSSSVGASGCGDVTAGAGTLSGCSAEGSCTGTGVAGGRAQCGGVALPMASAAAAAAGGEGSAATGSENVRCCCGALVSDRILWRSPHAAGAQTGADGAAESTAPDVSVTAAAAAGATTTGAASEDGRTDEEDCDTLVILSGYLLHVALGAGELTAGYRACEHRVMVPPSCTRCSVVSRILPRLDCDMNIARLMLRGEAGGIGREGGGTGGAALAPSASAAASASDVSPSFSAGTGVTRASGSVTVTAGKEVDPSEKLASHVRFLYASDGGEAELQVPHKAANVLWRFRQSRQSVNGTYK